jgi:hypothetical protein
VAEFLSFSNPIPVFSISSQTQPSFFQSLSAINSLISVFFLQLSPANLGAKSFLRQKSFAAEFLRQKLAAEFFCGRIFTSSLDIQI